MKTFEDITNIVNDIQYKDYSFRVLKKDDGYLLQVIFRVPCTKLGIVQEQRCRKWYVSPHSCTSEIVRTALKAVEAAEMHELYENFSYKGIRIFDPHLNVDNLANNIQQGSIKEEIRTA